VPTARISEETQTALNELGGTFDTPDDVIQRVIREAGYTVPSESNPQDAGTVEHEKTELEEVLDNNLPQSDWLTTRKQRDVVVSVAERVLELPSELSVRDRRIQAQKYVLENSDVENIQTIQDQCGRRLFKDYKKVPNNSWAREFDRVLEQVESELGSYRTE
jgi:hypothetical protein